MLAKAELWFSRDYYRQEGWLFFLGFGPKEPPEEGMLRSWAFSVHFSVRWPVRLEWLYRNHRRWRVWRVTTCPPLLMIDIAHKQRVHWQGVRFNRQWVFKPKEPANAA